MSTTIDSLQIEIQSSSANAAGEIKNLAGALGTLKQNGAIGTAVKNIRTLSAALKELTPVASNVNKLNSLATALQKMKEVGSFAPLANSLSKLPGALKGISGIDFDRTQAKMQGLATALSPLREIKSSGLSGAVRSLSKLSEVTEKLDDDTIEAFAQRVEKLNQVLGPLAQKMTTIQAGLSGLNAKFRSTSSASREMGDGINTTALNMSSFITVIQAGMQAVQGLVEKLAEFISQAIEWDGIAARFGRGFGESADETYAWIQRLNEEMGLNVQQFMQYSSVYATMLTGFGVGIEDATKMALGYTELTYDIWAGYNDIYKNFEDASEAVKSAIAGEVEPIRRAGFTIVEATLAQTAANYGLDISLTTATEAQKSYLRYLTLVDQAYAQNLVGTYAKELNTAEGVMRTFSQMLKTLVQAIGSLFLPILIRVMPYIQAFVELLTDAVQAIAALFGITIQGVDWSSTSAGIGSVAESTDGLTDSLGSAAEAAKELKNAAIGIDELNVISPPSDSGGSGSSGGSGGVGTGFEDLDVDSLWDESIFHDIQSQVDAIKEKFKEWMPLIATIGAALAGLTIASLLSNMGEAIANMDKLGKLMATLATVTIEAALVFIFADNYLESGNLAFLLGEAIVTAGAGYLLYKGLGPNGVVIAMATSVVAQLAAITLNVADGTVDIGDPELWIQTAMTTLTGAAGGLFAFKGIAGVGKGKGALLGALFTLSMSLAGITIGGVIADGADIKDALTGLASSVFAGAATAGLFTFLGIATGGTGFLVGFAVMAALNIVGSIIGSVTVSDEDIKKELEDRLGTIELDNESLEVYVGQITAIPREITIDTNVWNEELEAYEVKNMTVTVDAALDFYADEKAVRDGLEDTVESLMKTIDTYNLKIALGVDVDYEDYTTAIDSFLTQSQAYLDQYYVTASIALEILGADSDGSLESTLSDFYSTSSAALAEKGAELKQIISDGFVDGEWIPDKLQEAIDLQKEIQEIIDYASDVEYRAEIANIQLEVSGANLTPESLEKALSEAQTVIEDRLASLEDVKVEGLKIAIMEYDANIADGMSEAAAKKIYDATVADIERTYQEGVVEVQYGTVDFGLTTLRDAFAEEIALAESEGWFNFSDQLAASLDPITGVAEKWNNGDGEVYTHVRVLVENIAQTYQMEAERLSPEVRASMEALLKVMEPTMADFEEIAATSRAAGKQVPQGVREGLNDYNEIAALAGDADAINYMLGQQFSTDSTFLNTLAYAENAGKQIDESVAAGLLNNINYVTDEATGIVTGIQNAATGEIYAITPVLQDNLEDMGVNLGDALGSKYEYVYNETTGVLEAIVDSTTGNTAWVSDELSASGVTVGESLSDGLYKGMDKDKTSGWTKVKKWAGDMVDSVKEFFGIHSPSKVFEEIGEFLVDGLWQGLADSYDALAKKVGGWIDDLVSNFTEFDFVGALGDTWDWVTDLFKTEKTGPVEFDVSPKNDSAQWWSNVKNWWSEKVGAVQDFTTKATNSASTWWSNVKAWWGEKVGSVADFKTNVSNSASTWWSNVKTWWGDKVGSVANFKTNVSNSSKTWWSNAKTWWSEKVGSVANFKTNVSNSSKTWWSNVKKWWKEKVGSVSNFKTNVSNTSKTWWSNVKKWWNDKVGSVSSFSVNVKNNASTWWSNVKKWWNDKAGSLKTKLDVQVPTIKVKWETASAFGKSFKYPTGFSLKFAADGGIFDAGSLIWAGERGAEIVANAGGGKTGVMNVEQMQQAVYEGVLAAMSAAQRSSSSDSGQSIHVYLDGKQITAAVEKRQRERGASIMGSQVFSF